MSVGFGKVGWAAAFGWWCGWLVLLAGLGIMVLWFCGFGVGVVGLVGSPCDGFCAGGVGIVAVGVMLENSTVCL
ncbi:hypothetical protein [Cutibacterium namnetense]|uniref:hypothetical protein n=1 Tax=Cutibacterium namnetense TaxID=1574624 RepID=UPI00254D23AE|nr:hypothetical protein [Cutibacterium namnetense]